MDFALRVDRRVKLKESEKRYKYLNLARKQKNMEHKSDGDTNYNWIGKVTRGLGNKRTNRYFQDKSSTKIGQSTEKMPGDLRRLAVT